MFSSFYSNAWHPADVVWLFRGMASVYCSILRSIVFFFLCPFLRRTFRLPRPENQEIASFEQEVFNIVVSRPIDARAEPKKRTKKRDHQTQTA